MQYKTFSAAPLREMKKWTSIGLLLLSTEAEHEMYIHSSSPRLESQWKKKEGVSAQLQGKKCRILQILLGSLLEHKYTG